MSARTDKIIWVSWERHRRTRGIVAALDIPLFEFHSRHGRWLRHPAFVLKTIITLVRERPDVLIVQNPSVFLTMLAILLRPLLRYRLVVDAHNAGVYACEEAHKKFNAIYPFMHRHTDLTLVTNSVLADIVTRNGGQSFELIDPLPDFTETGAGKDDGTSGAAKDGPARVTFVCTFARDEPYEEVFGAAALLRPEVTVQVTGNVEAHRDSFRTEPPDNVVFTGFVPDADFVTLLRESDCIIDLTTLPDCLVCGAYEATALGVPVILSDTAANREIFIPGAVLASNNARDLARAIREVLRHRREHQAEMQILREHLVRRWEQQFGRFSRWLDGSTL